MKMKGKVALVTGGTSGIGKAAALLFAREGANVAILGRKAEHLEKACRDFSAAEGEVLPIAADISDEEQMQAAIRQTVERFGRLDVVFANAGINGVWAPIDQLEPSEFDQTVKVNLRGTFLTIKYAVPELKRAGGGSVIITSSINGTRVFSNTGATAYSCTKAAQVAMAKMLSLELASDRIRVNVICPGAISTNIGESTEQRGVEEAREPVEFPQGQVPLTRGKPGSSEQVAKLALFLASDDSDHITGTEVWIDGAQSHLIG
jgi:NAD(P)-dependent dehydrogenase (short-subunit alcohol dehydrogenase family)